MPPSTVKPHRQQSVPLLSVSSLALVHRYPDPTHRGVTERVTGAACTAPSDARSQQACGAARWPSGVSRQSSVVEIGVVVEMRLYVRRGLAVGGAVGASARPDSVTVPS